jgi:hypothetical protein
VEEPDFQGSSPEKSPVGFSHFEDCNEGIKAEGKQGFENRDGSKVLPFEFVALEACLEAACSCLESEVSIRNYLLDRFSYKMKLITLISRLITFWQH